MIIDNLRMEGAKIWLRPLGPADASAAYAGWLNDSAVNKYLETRQATIDDLENYINERRASDASLFLGIFWRDTGLHIGNIKLEPIDWKKKSAVLGILIGDQDYWGRGVATEAIDLLGRYAFYSLGLSRLTLGVISANQAAIEVYKKCGFTINKVEPKIVKRDGEMLDKVWMEKIKS